MLHYEKGKKPLCQTSFASDYTICIESLTEYMKLETPTDGSEIGVQNILFKTNKHFWWLKIPLKNLNVDISGKGLKIVDLYDTLENCNIHTDATIELNTYQARDVERIYNNVTIQTPKTVILNYPDSFETRHLK